MPLLPSPGTSSQNGNEKLREQTLRLIITGLTSRPAYLIIFGLGLVNTTILGLMVVFQNSEHVVAMSFGSWFIYCIVALGVVYRIELNAKPSEEEITDQTAQDEFQKGADASFLAGDWESEWVSPVDTIPPEKVALSVSTRGCRVFVFARVIETGREFWMWGRLSDNNELSLLAWGRHRAGFGGLSGVDFLIIDNDNIDSIMLKGNWIGHGKQAAVIVGTTSWKKKGSDCDLRGTAHI